MVSCGRLSWKLVCFWAHINIVISYRINNCWKYISGSSSTLILNNTLASAADLASWGGFLVHYNIVILTNLRKLTYLYST